MKKFFFSIVFTIFLILNTIGQVSYSKLDSISVHSNCHWFKTGIEKKDAVTIRLGCAATVFHNKPLYILDGVITDEFELKNLNPNNIESIWILKNSEATALYGCMGASGVVIITTKIAGQRTITVKDMCNGELLPSASVEIISTERREDTIHLIADSLGRIKTNKIVYGKEYELKITRAGYKSFRFITNTKQLGKNYTVLLERKYENLEGVTIKSLLGKLRPRKADIDNFLVCYFKCYIGGVKVSSGQTVNEGARKFSSIKLYPNPVLHSQEINIEFENKEDAKVTVKLFSLDSKLISSGEYQIKNGVNRVTYSLNDRLSAGLYVLQIIDENNRLIKTDKLIIQ